MMHIKGAFFIFPALAGVWSARYARSLHHAMVVGI